jgi:hypothetical protein
MTKTAGRVVLGVALCLCLGTLPLGAEPSASAEVLGWTEPEACQASQIDVGSPKVRLASSGLPACPTTSPTCVGGSSSRKCGVNDFCKAGSTINVTDTGDAACDQNGKVLACPAGQTIHIKTIPCTQCPCCSQTPACFCPLNCGAITSWHCE